MVERVTSGVAEVDLILNGGFPAHSTTMLVGEPGTGKTVLAQGFLYANCRNRKKGLYLTTAAEPLDKNLRYVQGFSFFRPEAVQEEVIYEDLSHFMVEGGLESALGRLTELLRQHEPDFLVMDSFKSFTTFASSDEEFHRLLHHTASLLTNMPITSLWVGEYATSRMSQDPEFAIVDGVIELKLQKDGVRDLRHLRVLKMRGTGFAGGEHAFRISSDGLHVFPRLATPVLQRPYAPRETRMTTGVPLIDGLIPDGVWKGTNTVVFGPPGVGKTLVGLEYIFSGIERGERGLVVGFQENTSQLKRFAEEFGWDWSGAVSRGDLFHEYNSPLDVFIDEVVMRLLRKVEEQAVSIVMIDGLNDLERAALDSDRFHEFMYSLTQELSRAGVSTIMTNDMHELFMGRVTTPYGISHMSDNILLLHYVRDDSRIRRAAAMIKSRSNEHGEGIHLFEITSRGTVLGPPTVHSALGYAGPSD